MTRHLPLPRLAALVAGLAAASATLAAPRAVPVQPTFHMAPAALPEPADVDAGGTNLSAQGAPFAFRIEAAQRGLATARLTPQALALHLARARAQAAGSEPLASGIVAAVFTPAQIRMAYGLPELPAAGAAVSATVAATLGARQTIYIVDANHNPNAFDDLNRFSSKFGLPTCSAVKVGTLPLPAAPAGCTFSVAYADGSNLRSTPPAYDPSWAAEIALDVEWAHAIAPFARIVLIEAPGAMSNQLSGAVALANRMGPGVVSMSFGAPEGSWMGSVDGTFTAAGMTYVASSGDDGAGMVWPAASSHVLAVGGTSLAWAGGGTRHEVAWSGSGGGTSAYMALPAWQSGLGLTRRTTSDVAFNADPVTGQYVAVTSPSTGTTSWNSYGGTSIAAPQWAGIVAIANAIRATVAKERLGDLHATLYRSIATVPGSYAAAFADITDGNDGACASCRAAIGYDRPTGWGTPKVAGLLPLLTGVAASRPVAAENRAPVFHGGSFSATTISAFGGFVSASDPDGDALAYTMTGGPADLRLSTAGALSWARPVKGSYTLHITARDPGGLAASATWTLVVNEVKAAPVVNASSASGRVGAELAVQMVATDANGDALRWQLAHAPAGMTISAGGRITWHPAQAGTWVVTVRAIDPSGLGGFAKLTVTIAVPRNPAARRPAPVASRGGQRES